MRTVLKNENAFHTRILNVVQDKDELAFDYGVRLQIILDDIFSAHILYDPPKFHVTAALDGRVTTLLTYVIRIRHEGK